ncbi:uncharacterized protein LOC130743298 isoform X5 [Lotus japonicus]|uniref:uncharacterized protein LOC130743298 isoform X5 n=1 Tax=Lotus japonicus TaxID=34305 RepID=UPI00258977A3|nr:uncharacterized protein LOC130743298 isoform X5 [Lotus japonicus]
MEFIQNRVEPWMREQGAKLMNVSWGPLQWRMRWPWSTHREEKKRMKEQYERRRKQLHDLSLALKADSISDLQDLLCCMVLSECVYKRPASEMIRAINKFKADFGGQVVGLERVQPSSDHVLHRYLLAEAGDTLFASFIGTKQYKDIIADANILQGAIFHEDAVAESDANASTESDKGENQNGKEYNWNPLESRSKQLKSKYKPAAHRGFMARAKGIPALELYRLAQKKKRKLVLCGHSLGGAVAALATLAILRVIAASSSSKENENVSIKCITFSQPPVGNAALRDYVNRKGWQHYFKSYCIPEDLVPRILSPAYFHHYNAQLQSIPSENETNSLLLRKQEQGVGKPKENDGEQLVLGVGPVQRSFWRLSRLVPLEGLRRQFSKHQERRINSVETNSLPDSLANTLIEEDVVEPQSLEIQEGSDGISLKPFRETDKHSLEIPANGKTYTMRNSMTEDEGNWRKVPYLPSYVPFGQLYLLGNTSVESLSGAEYSKLTSVRSVIAELREKFQSHKMKSYRSRFRRIYDLYMSDDSSPFLGAEQFPYLQQLLGVAAASTVEVGHIVESPVIRTATSIVPLGWNGGSGAKSGEPLKVDITGHGLHLCSLVHAQVNGNWFSTTVESFPSAPNYSLNQGVQSELQKMRISVGAPLRSPPKHQTVLDSSMLAFTSEDPKTASSAAAIDKDKFVRPESLNNFLIFCTSDFKTVSKEVHMRTRRVRLVGLEGAGKTTLLKAILTKCKQNTTTNDDEVSEVDVKDYIADGLCYCDSAGINMQDRISGKMIGSAKMKDGLYYFEDTFRNKAAQGLCGMSCTSVRDQIMLWHNRLGHPNFQYLRHLFPDLFKNVNCSSLECESCVLAKNQRAPYYSQPYHASRPFYLIHSDVWGPSKITTQFGKRWFVTFIDDHTRLCWVYLMHEKSEVPNIFKSFSQMVETQFDTKISILRSDNGTEYFNQNLNEFLKNKGIQHQSTCPNTPQQNGTAERKNKHLLEVACAIMFESNVPKYLWGDAVLTAAYLINRMPTRVLNYRTPLENFKTIFPACRLHTDMPLKVFGCTVFMHKPSTSRSKLDPRAEKCIFVGYSPNQKGYRVFNPITKKLCVSMDVTFLEHQPFFQKNSLQGENNNVSEDNFLHEPLPIPIVDTENTNFIDECNKEEHVETSSEISKENLMPDLGGAQTEKEIPQSKKEFHVYTRKYPKRTKDQSIISAPSQPEIPEEGQVRIPQEIRECHSEFNLGCCCVESLASKK